MVYWWSDRFSFCSYYKGGFFRYIIKIKEIKTFKIIAI